MPKNTDSTAKRLEIRKYPNRRYYDVTRSRHLTLEDIRSLVREGDDIRVTDSKTSADITAKVLAQIILELDAEKIEVFPVSLLMRLIRVNDRLVQDFMERYFDQALSMFLQYREQFEKQLRGGDGFGALYSSLANWNRAMLNPFAMPMMGGGGFSGMPGSTAGPAKPDGQAQELQEKINSLQQHVAGLEEKLGKTRRRPHSQPRRSTE
jgi:polyhydroxyalkanoate synthesis repressor PhaR